MTITGQSYEQIKITYRPNGPTGDSPDIRLELPDDSTHVAYMTGEAAIKIGHELIAAGEKALKKAGKIHES